MIKSSWAAGMLYLCCVFNISAQTLTVRDKSNDQPLQFVTIYGENGHGLVTTDAHGNADISALKQQKEIKISLIGYQQQAYPFSTLEQKGFKVYLTASDFTLDEVVVSAIHWEQNKKDLPSRIATIKPAEVKFQNPQTAADLLNVSGEVFIQKSQLGGGSPIIRGFATNRVLLTVDGIRMNNAIFRSGNLQNVISLDPFTIEKTEIIFGPGAVIYGSDALGGVMGFYTTTPRLSAGEKMMINGKLALRWSSANAEKTGHADIALGFKKWALITSITYSDYEDLKMGSNGPKEYLRPEYVVRQNGEDRVVANPDPEKQVPTGYDQINLMQKIRFVPNKAWDFQYGFHYSTTSDYPRYDRLIRYRKDQLRSGQWYYGPQRWMMNDLKVTHHPQNRFFDVMNAIIAYQHFEESRHDRDFGDVVRANREEKVNALSLNLDFDKKINARHHLYYGAEALLNTVNSFGTNENIQTGKLTAGPSRYPNDSHWNSYALYGSWQYFPSDRVTLQTGIRFNRVILNAQFDDTFYSFPFDNATINTGAFTGSAGLTYRPGDSWQLSANLSTGFRAPNIDDVGKVFDSSPGSVVVPNPGLRSEYAWNAEIGLKKIINATLKIDLTGYYTLLSNAMVRRNFMLNGKDSIEYDGELSQVQAIQNAAHATVYGIQAGMNLDLPLKFKLTSHFNYQKGEEELDDGTTSPLRHAAPWFGSTHIAYETDRFKADLYAVYNGEVANSELAAGEKDKAYLYANDANGDPYSPGWYTLNFKTQWRVKDIMTFTAGVENITDQRYRPYSSGIVAPGRNFMIALRASF